MSPPPPPAPAAAPPDGARQVTESVEVRTEGKDGLEVPAQLLRRGRLWVVRGAHLLQAGTGQQECWRVEAADGPCGRAAELDLVRSPTGEWRLSEVRA